MFCFKIELLDFKGEDLFEDGGIIRRIKQKGEGYSNPNEGAAVESECLFGCKMATQQLRAGGGGGRGGMLNVVVQCYSVC